MNCHPDSGVSSYFSYSSSASSASTSLRDSFLLTTQSSLIAILACIIWIIAAFSHNGRAHAEMPIPDRDPAAGLEREENRGSLIIMGGSERFDNRIIWAEIVKKAGGEGSRIAVFPTASGAPMVDGEDVVRVLKDLGADAFLVPLAIRGFENDYREVARDPAMVASVRQSQGVFFVGGEQARIRQALVSPEGDNTPLLEAVWSVYREGGVIAGTSAGAAVMSRIMFRSAQSVLNTMLNGVGMGREIDYGLGFLDEDWFIDQHCLVRGRFARALVAMHKQGFGYGFGIDEDTALVVERDEARVIGYRGVLVFDLSGASSNAQESTFNLKNARLSYLDRGDSINLRTLRITPSAEKQAGRLIDPRTPEFRPRFRARPIFNDILGNMAVHDLMVRLIDNRGEEGLGLAFDGAAALTGPTRGFEFRFYRGDDSVGWQTEAFGGDDYTVANIHVDITPVQLVGPLYTK
jgi:cyanophycinase